MKKYIKSSRYVMGNYYFSDAETEEYRGYFIDAYLNDDDEYEYVVDIDLAGDGDEHTFNSLSEAKEFIDDLYLLEDLDKRF